MHHRCTICVVALLRFETVCRRRIKHGEEAIAIEHTQATRTRCRVKRKSFERIAIGRVGLAPPPPRWQNKGRPTKVEARRAIAKTRKKIQDEDRHRLTRRSERTRKLHTPTGVAWYDCTDGGASARAQATHPTCGIDTSRVGGGRSAHASTKVCAHTKV